MHSPSFSNVNLMAAFFINTGVPDIHGKFGRDNVRIHFRAAYRAGGRNRKYRKIRIFGL